MDHLIARLTKSAKRLGLTKTATSYLLAELALIEAVTAGYDEDTSFEIARSVLLAESTIAEFAQTTKAA